ncbi:hypothetical protein AGR3A_Cc250120 [Agrobacterium tomkonis CFBP 6623]|uniref:Uncharacterized protein n=1 Tax=Agrobacterium tomkonis CFBP 6623 TaxID=1183432 RepID=A0A1S7PEZ5_9HYPH|nr:hypothetical protein AGR3A_Cc250120 [Agrobacterium tomkonis CFBP 6623]
MASVRRKWLYPRFLVASAAFTKVACPAVEVNKRPLACVSNRTMFGASGISLVVAHAVTRATAPTSVKNFNAFMIFPRFKLYHNLLKFQRAT